MSAVSEASVLNRAVTERNDIGHRYLRAALFSGASGLLSRLFLGFTPLVLARLLGLEKYGVYALVMSLVGVVAGTSSLGQNAALQKFLPEYAVTNPTRGRAILVTSVRLVAVVIIVVSVVLLAASHTIARVIYRDPSLAGVFRFAVLMIAGTVLFNHFSSIAIGLHRIRTYGTASVIRAGAFLILGSLGAALFGLYGALAGQVVGATLAVSILAFDAHRTAAHKLPGESRFFTSVDMLREIMTFGIPALLAGVVVAFGIWSGSTMLVRHAGFQQLGLFGAAYSLMQVILLLPSALSMPAVSYLAETRAARGERAFNDLVGNNLRLIWALTLPISFACALFSRPLMVLLFGPAFAPASQLACWMAIAALVIAINSQIGFAIASLGRMWQALALNLIWLAVFLPAAYFCISKKDSLGLAWAYCLSYALFTLVVWRYSDRYLKVQYQKLGVLLVTTGCAALVGVLWQQPSTTPITIAEKLGAVLLLLTFEWSWLLQADERNKVLEAFSR